MTGMESKRQMAADKQHNLEATVFVYKHYETGQIKAEYIDAAKLLEDDPAWEHLATLEPRMWIECHYHYAEAEAEKQEPDDDLTIAYMSGVHDGKASAMAERNFCERCGKRLGKNDWDIHTCTPPSEAEKQEPVAWMDIDEKGSVSGLRYWSEPDNRHEVALYTSPLQRRQEPEAWRTEVKNGKLFFHIGNQSFQIDYTGTKEAIAWMENQLQHALSKLISPPQRQWVGLTEQERNDIEDRCEMIIGKPAFELIEDRLKEKNT